LDLWGGPATLPGENEANKNHRAFESTPMKKFLRGALGLMALGMAVPAVAADLPVAYGPAPVMIPAWYDWSGLYLGINGGWASSRNCWDQLSDLLGPVVDGNEGCNRSKGYLVGGQIGVRWQAGSWVFGAELQGDSADLTGSNPSLFAPGVVNRTRVDNFGLLTGQIGYAIDTVMVYAKGGGAVAGIRYHGFIPVLGTDPVDFTGGLARWGGAAGAGIEFAFLPNWSLAAEYDHVFFGSRAENFSSTTVTGLFTREDRIQQDMDIFTVRLNYRIGGPVIGKY
jgi:outer membrane immunogenic protein